MVLNSVTVRSLLAKYEEVLPKNINSEWKFSWRQGLLVLEGAKKPRHSLSAGSELQGMELDLLKLFL